MKQSQVFLLSIVTLVFFFYVGPLSAEEDVKARIEALEKELQLLKSSLVKQEEKAQKDQAIITELKEENKLQAQRIEDISKAHEHLEKRFTLEEFYGPRVSEEFAKKGVSPQFGGIYTKPFLRRFGRNTYLGGYMDASYRLTESKTNDKRFEVLRFVPFIYSDVSDRVKLASEIEIEHGGASDKKGMIGDSGRDGEVKLEFATVDFLIKDWVNFRGGLILVPLGKFNLVHDAPLQNLVDRPLVDVNIIPTTLTQAGMGFYGTLYPTEMSKLDYEIYATNGFGNNIDSRSGIRNARLFRYDRENNKNPAIVARVAFSPFLGLEIGGSVHHGKYDRGDYLTISALDFVYQKGPFELIGEGAYADIQGGGRNFGVNHMFGYYIEPRYNFMPEFLHDAAPKFFRKDSNFALTFRWEQVDLGSGRNSPLLPRTIRNRQDRATLGLGYRYTQDTIFKVDYQWNIEHRRKEVDNNAFIFGVATYF